jgi:hypothetical protein
MKLDLAMLNVIRSEASDSARTKGNLPRAPRRSPAGPSFPLVRITQVLHESFAIRVLHSTSHCFGLQTFPLSKGTSPSPIFQWNGKMGCVERGFLNPAFNGSLSVPAGQAEMFGEN